MRDSRPRVLIVGAGFGGVWAARGLAGKPFDVTLLDRNNYHTFLPLLYQVGAAELGPADIAYPIRSMFRRAPNIRVRMGSLLSIDLSNRIAHVDTGDIPYDRLILATGTRSADFGVSGVRDHAFSLKTMDDALRLGRHLMGSIEAADRCRNPSERRRLLGVVVVGGGATGVEYAGALAELVAGPLARDFPGIGKGEVRVSLVEGGDRLLPAMAPSLGEYTVRRLRHMGVEVRVGTQVDSVDSGGVHLRDGGFLEAGTVVWSAGVTGAVDASAWGLPVKGGGRVEVGPSLQVRDHPEIMVIGDMAFLERNGSPLPQVAQVAIQQGLFAARALRRMARGSEPGEFRYRDPGMLAVIGRNAAVAELRFGRYRGPVAWVIWVLIHITWLIGFRNRFLVLFQWAWNYLFFRRSVRLILPYILEKEGAPKDP